MVSVEPINVSEDEISRSSDSMSRVSLKMFVNVLDCQWTPGIRVLGECPGDR